MSDPLDDAFDELTGSLADAGRLLRSHPFFVDPENRASGYAFVISMLLARLEEDVIFDPDFPSFRSVDTRIREAGDNPDQRYWTSRVRGGERYRIWGTLGSARRVDVQVFAGVPAQPGAGRSAGFLGFETLEVDADGAFEVVLSPDREDGNWVACPPDATRVFVRQVFSDWDRELPGEVHIDRIGAEGVAKPRLDDADLAARLRTAASNLTSRVGLWPEMVRTSYLSREPNRMSPLYDPGSVGGVHGRWMSHGTFDLGDDEALVVRMWPSDGNYQGIQLGDLWFSSLEYANRQTSLSGDQAIASADGTTWFVISARDPGVANWLDTTGRRRGIVLIRYDGTNGEPFPDDRQPTSLVVPLRDLPAVLPPDMATAAPAERIGALAARRRHVQRRFGT